MAISDSLKVLGINIEDAHSVAVGLGRLVLPKEHKLKLLKEYLVERNIELTKNLEDLLGE